MIEAEIRWVKATVRSHVQVYAKSIPCKGHIICVTILLYSIFKMHRWFDHVQIYFTMAHVTIRAEKKDLGLG